MRILMIAACPFPGNRGTPSRILKMTEALARRGIKVDVLTYFNKDFSIGKKSFDIYRIKKISFCKDNSPGPKIWKPLADSRLVKKGIELCKKNKYDLIHAHHIEGGICGVILKRKFNIPLIYDSHVILESEIKSFKKYNFLFIPFVLRSIEKLCYKNSSGIIYVAKEIKDYVKKKNLINNKPELVLPTGTNISEIESLIKKLKNPLNKFKGKNIVYTGSVSRYQNLEDVLEVSKLGKHLNFFIVTGQPESDCNYLLDQIKKEKLNNIFIISNKNFEEQLAYATYADILLSPRHFLGGIPQKITNYIVLKKKIVASKGSVKILDNNSACLYKGGDIKGFYTQLTRALNDKNHSKEKKAFKIVKKYDWDNLIKNVITLYKKVLVNEK